MSTVYYQLFNIRINADKRQEHLSILKILTSILYQDQRNKVVVVAGGILFQEHKICPDETELLKIYLSEIAKYCPVYVFSANKYVEIAINSFIAHIPGVKFFCKYGVVCETSEHTPAQKSTEEIIFMSSDDINRIIRDENSPGFPRKQEILCGNAEKIIVTGEINDLPGINWDFMQKYRVKIIMCWGEVTARFITNSVAHSGSIMQSDARDDICKGMIKWENYSGRFIRLNIEFGYIRLRASGDKMIDDVGVHLPAKPYSIALEYSDCSELFVEKTASELYKKYNIHVNLSPIAEKQSDRNELQRNPGESQILLNIISDAISDWTKTSPDIPGTSRDDIIRQLDKAYDEFAQYISESSSCVAARNTRWKVKKLLWSNCYCYDEYNVINFDDSVRGCILGCIANNKYGKSSIIDILLFVLFDYVNRGTKSAIQNKFAVKKYIIVCHLDIGGTTYIIDKRARTLTTCDLLLMRIDADGKRNNITGKTNEETYAVLSAMIGNADTFLKINCIRQNSHDMFWRSSASARTAILHRIFGIDVIDRYKSVISDKLRAVGEKIIAMNKPGEKRDYDQAIAEYERDISDFHAELGAIDAEISQLSEEKMQLYKRFAPDVAKTPDEINAEIYRATKIKTKLLSAMSELSGKLQSAGIQLTNNISALKTELSKLLYNLTPGDESHYRADISELEQLRDRLTAEEQQDTNSRTYQANELRANISKLNTYNRELSAVSDELHAIAMSLPHDITKYMTNNSVDVAKISGEIDAIKQRESSAESAQSQIIAQIGRMIALFQQIVPIDKSELLLNREISVANVRSAHRFSDACKDCVTNREIIQNNLGNKRDKLAEIMRENENIRTKNAQLTGEINAIFANIQTEIGKLVGQSADSREQIQQLSLLNHYVRSADIITKMNKLQAKKQQLSSDIAKLSADIANNKLISADYCNNAETNAKKPIDNSLADINNKILLHNNFIKYKKDNEKIILLQTYLSKHSEVAGINQQLKDINAEKNIAMENEKIILRINEINEKIVSADKQRNDLHAKIRKYQIDCAVLSAERKKYADNSHKITGLLAQKHAYNIFLHIISAREGALSQMLSLRTKLLIDYMNSVLGIFANNPVVMNGTGGLNIMQNDIEIPLDMASGYQIMMIDLATRMSLYSLARVPLADILIIDEGFNCFDVEHTKTLNELFVTIRSMFGLVLVISHNPDVNVKLEKQMYISRKNNKSSLIFGEKPEDFDSIIFARKSLLPTRNLPASSQISAVGAKSSRKSTGKTIRRKNK